MVSTSPVERLTEIRNRIEEIKRQRRLLMDELRSLKTEEAVLRASGYTRRRNRRPPDVVAADKAARAIRRLLRLAKKGGDTQTILDLARKAGVIETE